MPSAQSQPGLTRERVVEAAVAIADAQGLESLSMRRLGEALGVEAMSLYNYVSSKDDLHNGMVDLVFREIDLPGAKARRWKSEMRQRALAAYEVLSGHRWAVGLLDSRTTPGVVTIRHFDDVLRCLRAAGFSVARSAQAYAVIYCFVYGFVLSNNGQSQATQAEGVAREMQGQDFPHAAEVLHGHLLKRGFDPVREFGRSLDLILDGLERELG